MTFEEALDYGASRADCSRACLEALATLVRSVKAIHGIMVECGSYKGGSAIVIASANPEKQLYCFDLFGGSPYGPGHGFEYLEDADLAEVREAVAEFRNIHLVAGLHETTVPQFERRAVAFLHMDSDHYESHKVCLTKFWPLLSKGGIAAFHDYEFLGVQQAIKETIPAEQVAADGMLANRVVYFEKA